jgi:GDP-4-dehydro-6-deoxy-D-mannose reductase
VVKLVKVLITGSNGFLGSHLVDFCISNNHVVYGLDHPSASFYNLKHHFNERKSLVKLKKKKFCGKKILIPSDEPHLSFLECELSDDRLLEHIIRELKPELIFHFAAQPYVLRSWEDPVETIETNVIGTLNIFEPIKKYDIKSRVILACSSTEFGSTAYKGEPLKEDDPLLALHPYGISKVAAELLSRQYWINFKIETINLRFFNLTGTRRVNDVTSDFIQNVARIELGLQPPTIEVGNLEPYRDFLDVRDAVEAIWTSATKGTPGETYHVCSGKKTQIKELLAIALSFTNKQIEVKKNVDHKWMKALLLVIIRKYERNSDGPRPIHWRRP